MTDKNQETDNNEQDAIPTSNVMVHQQFLKDLSFENPNAPEIIKRIDIRPQMGMNIGIDVDKMEDEEFEHLYCVTLTVQATAKRNDDIMFITEISYGATVSISDLEEERHHPLLFIEVPQLIFPYARQIMAAATQAGGYNALQLRPVNFRSMYLKRFGKDQEDQNTPED